VTLDLPERGLLLLRIRDEIRMTMDAYRTLYESSISFGVRKQLQAEEGLPELEATLADLLERKKAAEAQVLASKSQLELKERRLLEKRALEDKQRAEEIVCVVSTRSGRKRRAEAMPRFLLCSHAFPASLSSFTPPCAHAAATSSTSKSTWTPSSKTCLAERLRGTSSFPCVPFLSLKSLA
jgi:hypothetical protein